ncbi:hypothetical protein EAI_07112 [Harpegnathos saltator]|uniref:Tudor domain-containing protein n=1 Tax=Harpegnathos saltator TaxID=610380 RepID=E2BAE0_HARSA|nr:hypothetical protein EAI_07112 [Harpegnathos saltator]
MAIEHISTEKLCRGRLPVYVTHVESPTLFWVQLQFNREEVSELQAEIKWKMEQHVKRYLMFPHTVKTGLIVAVKDCGEWYRGTITHVGDSTAVINLGDWGRIIKKPITHLYNLPRQYHFMA